MEITKHSNVRSTVKFPALGGPLERPETEEEKGVDSGDEVQKVTMRPEIHEEDENIDFGDGDEVTEDDIWGNNYDFAGSVPEFEANYETTPMQVWPKEEYPTLLVKFGHPDIRYHGHKLRPGQFKKFHRCMDGDDGCVLCKANVKRVSWRIEFFYSPSMSRIVYMAFEERDRPEGLYVKLQEVLAGGYPAVIEVSKSGQFDFECVRLAPNDQTDFGEETIRKFVKELKAGDVDLGSLTPVASVELAKKDKRLEPSLTARGY
jgi:hypothetical protein